LAASFESIPDVPMGDPMGAMGAHGMGPIWAHGDLLESYWAFCEAAIASETVFVSPQFGFAWV